jgi:dTDP-4-dehydrorhamnose reductase
MAKKRLILLGVGQTATEVINSARDQYDEIIGTTRDARKLNLFQVYGIGSLLLDGEGIKKLGSICDGADVLISFPPDGRSDQELAQESVKARALIYISSTGVYGKQSGVIDESSIVEPEFPGAQARLDAEKIWSSVGAIILRAPGLYSETSGLHLRLTAGTYRLPGNCERFTSRIHLKDLARIIIASFQKPLPKGSIYLVGDQLPTTQKEIITWLCSQMNLAMPESVPLEAVSPTLRGNRQVSAQKILDELQLDLKFPTYKEGYGDCLKVYAEGSSINANN